MLKLSALNFSSLYDQKNVRHELDDTVRLAAQLEHLGYHRYWLGEHHTFEAAHSSPELLLPLIARSTTKLRVGVAGILIHLHSPYKVAKDFALLASLFPNRIDLGLAASSAEESTRAALEAPTFEPLPKRIGSLLENVGGASQTWNAEDVKNPPYIRGSQHFDTWMLGSGGPSTSKLAAERGLGLSLAFFVRSEAPSPKVISCYREKFNSSKMLTASKVNIVLSGVCAEDEEEANTSANHWLNHGLVKNIVGTPSQCKEKIMKLQADYDIDEVVFLDLSPTFEGKLRSYRLLSEALLG